MLNFILVILTVIITSPFVLKQPLAVGLLVCTLFLIDTELLGMVYAYGLNINRWANRPRERSERQ
jgi:hypothetical protein